MRGSGWLRAKLWNPVLELLKQGMAPQKLALCLALGAAIGCFPLIGTTTTLCALLALALGLNLAAMQAVNYAVYPLQILLLIPLMRLGEILCRVRAEALTAQGIVAAFHAGFLPALHTLGWALAHAVLGWLVVAPVAGAAIYLLALPPLRRAMRHKTDEVSQ